MTKIPPQQQGIMVESRDSPTPQGGAPNGTTDHTVPTTTHHLEKIPPEELQHLIYYFMSLSPSTITAGKIRVTETGSSATTLVLAVTMPVTGTQILVTTLPKQVVLHQGLWLGPHPFSQTGF